jgi:putative membrane protein
MKTLLRNTAIYTFALFLLPKILNGVVISDSLLTYVLGGFFLTLLFMVIKPILHIISFPLNLITLGLFSAFTNVIILYLLTVIHPGIRISAFTYPGVSVFGFVVPRMDINVFFAYVLSAVILAIIVTAINWLIE